MQVRTENRGGPAARLESPMEAYRGAALHSFGLVLRALLSTRSSQSAGECARFARAARLGKRNLLR